MSFLDDLETRVEQTVSTKASTDINDYLDNRLTDDLTQLGQAARGNLTAAQIAAGQKGATPAIAAPQGGVFKIGSGMSIAVVGLIVIGAAIYFSKRRRG